MFISESDFLFIATSSRLVTENSQKICQYSKNKLGFLNILCKLRRPLSTHSNNNEVFNTACGPNSFSELELVKSKPESMRASSKVEIKLACHDEIV